jgi:hypothetical protein
MEEKISVRIEFGSAVLSSAAAIAGIWSISAGVLPPRLRVTAGFLAIWAATAVYVAIANALERSRVRSPRPARVPMGVRLRTPAWTLIGDSFYLVGVGARVGAIAAAIGFTGVGVGVSVTFVALSVAMYAATLRIGVTSITFEPTGLRAQIAGARFLVPWTSISNIEREGKSERRKLIFLQLRNISSVTATLEPDNPKTRARLRSFTMGSEGRLMLSPWIGGLDSLTLIKEISAAIGRGPQPTN